MKIQLLRIVPIGVYLAWTSFANAQGIDPLINISNQVDQNVSDAMSNATGTPSVLPENQAQATGVTPSGYASTVSGYSITVKPVSLKGLNQDSFASQNSFLGLGVKETTTTQIGVVFRLCTNIRMTSFVSGILNADPQPCKPNCPFCAMTARGEQTGYAGFTGQHIVAEKMRDTYGESRRGWVKSLHGIFKHRTLFT